MKTDNVSAFTSEDYDRKIRQTIPFYEDFYKQALELVMTVFDRSGSVAVPLHWLDIGCGTGMMGNTVFKTLQPERFVFLDSSEEMIRIVKEQFSGTNTEFAVSDVRELSYDNEFNVVTSILVFHYLNAEERKEALKRSYAALKEGGIFISFENCAPLTETGKRISLKKWERFQTAQGKSPEESRRHIERYGTEYYPVNMNENLELLLECGFKAVELLWFSNMQAGFWGMK